MAKKKPAEPDPSTEAKKTGTIRVEEDIAFKISVIASITGVSSSELCSPILRPIVERKYAEAIAAATKRVQPAPKE